MDIESVLSIINSHRQMYEASCSPSLVEMLLKLSGAADADYYDEQIRDQNNNIGLTNIKNKTIKGKTFRQFNPQGAGISLLEKSHLSLRRESF